MDNKENLRPQGFYYPDSGVFLYGHHYLAFQKSGLNTIGHPVDNNVWEKLRDELHRVSEEDVILSSEEFSSIQGRDQIYSLGRELKGYSVEVYVYLRRQDEYLQSVYNQQTKDWASPQCLDSQSFIDAHLANNVFLNYTSWLKLWAEVFGKDKVHVFSYDDACLAKEGVVGHFSHELGLEQLVSPVHPNVNQSVSAKALELIRLSKVMKFPDGKREQLFNLALRAFPNFDGGAFSSSQREKIIDQYRAVNDGLCAEYGISFREVDVELCRCGSPLELSDMMIILDECLMKS
ncbi:hypothetical protein [Gilvimarinus chinensis]|uniref:hypothetical protein n=1 Tax=Gilvimarinus chinensis TaxID=396005 RepID=UPI0012F9E598|nr:hypothetical protein [Gilvimarinus chinensis]